MEIKNTETERAVLASMVRYGKDAFVDADPFINEKCFTNDANKVLYACLKKVFETSDTVDTVVLNSAAEQLDITRMYEREISDEFLKELSNVDIQLENVVNQSKKLLKLDTMRTYKRTATEIINDLGKYTGDEEMNEIISMVEGKIFDVTLLGSNPIADEPTAFGDGVGDWIEHVKENPCEMVGISSGFPRYDAAIGGGFRRGAVDLIGAAEKTGKSMLALNMGAHIAGNLDIPVLYVDTEMSEEEHYARLTAKLSKIPTTDIETGKFLDVVGGEDRVDVAINEIKEMPISHIGVGGMKFDETLSVIRRWIVRNVGTEGGVAKDCFVIYDYLKIMDTTAISEYNQEYQELTKNAKKLKDFAGEMGVPVLTFCQLNKDGETKETTSVLAGTKRLSWTATSITLFKDKTIDEIASTEEDAGNKKLVPLKSRFGQGWSSSDYINVIMTGEIGTVEEGLLFSEARKENQLKTDGFIVDESKDVEDKPF